MQSLRINLLAAAAVAGIVSGQAQAAEVDYAAADLHGNGASAPAVVVVKLMNCYAGKKDFPSAFPNAPSFGATDGYNHLGVVGGFSEIPEHVYNPVKPTASNPQFDCKTKHIQEDIEGEYVSTGSGGGVSNFVGYTAAAAGTAATNPFVNGTLDSDTAWNNIHFIFSENPLTAANITTFNGVEDGADNTLGTGDDVGLVAPIFVPAVIVPVALAYHAEYGRYKDGSGNVKSLTFQVGADGLELTRATYCGILDGTITNWNDPAIAATNANLRDPDHPLADWNASGVPIQLIGRSDSSGTTTLFTRHMAAVCGAEWGTAGASTIPAARRDGALTYDINGNFVSGTYTPGEFAVANTSSGVAATLDKALTDPVTNLTYTFNGKFGYIGADYVAPAETVPGIELQPAYLAEGLSTTKFLAPNAKNAAAALNAINPPESLTSGAYSANPACAGVAGKTGAGCRANPLAWVATTSEAEPIANPLKGYPILGTTNIGIYTCYVDPAVRTAMAGYFNLLYGKLPAQGGEAYKFPAKLGTNVALDAGGVATGVFPRNGLSALPGKWVKAITETFGKKGPGTLGALNLWVQNKSPTATSQVAGLLSNPNCTSGKGAAS